MTDIYKVSFKDLTHIDTRVHQYTPGSITPVRHIIQAMYLLYVCTDYYQCISCVNEQNYYSLVLPKPDVKVEVKSLRFTTMSNATTGVLIFLIMDLFDERHYGPISRSVL